MNLNRDNSEKVRGLLGVDLGEEFQVADWKAACETGTLHRQSERSHKMNPNVSRCRSSEGTLMSNSFSRVFFQELGKIFFCSLQPETKVCLLGLTMEHVYYRL